MATVRAAIIGCGGMGRSHARAMRLTDGIELVAVADRRAEAVQAMRDEFGVAHGYLDANALFSAERPDLVAIVTNGPSHAPLTITAAEAGVRYIYCEKPMACSCRDAQAMIDTCARRGTRLAINHTRRWSPAHHRLRDALAGGLVGRPRVFDYSLGAGRLGCNGSHVVDAVRLLSGQDVVAVTGWLDTTGTPDPRGPEFYDPGAHTVMHLADGARVYLDQMEDLGVPPLLSIVGSIGRVLIEELSGSWSVIARRPEDRDKSLASYGSPLVPQDFTVADCPNLGRWDEVQSAGYRNLVSDEPVCCSGEDGYKAIEAVLAVHLSDQRQHQPVALPLAGDDLDFRIDFT